MVLLTATIITVIIIAITIILTDQHTYGSAGKDGNDNESGNRSRKNSGSSKTSGSEQISTTGGGGGRHDDMTNGKNDNTTYTWYKRGLSISINVCKNASCYW